METHDLEAYYKAALITVSHASRSVQEGFLDPKKSVKTKTEHWDLVSEYDERTEKTIIGELSALFPSHKFMGEETANSDALTDNPTWIIDPIDGTNNFVKGFPACVISVGLAIKKEVVVGIICNPITNQMFSAMKGKGSYLNGVPIKTSAVEELKPATVALEVSLGTAQHLREPIVNRLDVCLRNVQGVRSIGCAAMSLAYVAMGVFDAYNVDGLYPWDYAAGSLIVTEAGGAVVKSTGGSWTVLDRSLLATGTKKLAENLSDLFNKTDNEEYKKYLKDFKF